MDFYTKIPGLASIDSPIDYHSKIILLGSCFSENMGDKFDYYKFQTTQNPLGILFHPKAIEQLLYNSVCLKKYTEASIFFHNKQWHSYEAHSSLSHHNKDILLDRLNNAITSTHKSIKSATHIIITLGNCVGLSTYFE